MDLATSHNSQSAAFGGLLFELRSRAGLGQRALARLTGLPPSTISEIENGRKPPPLPAVVDRLCAQLDASAEETGSMQLAAARERAAIGVRVSRSTPKEVAALVRDVCRVGSQLNPTTIRAIRMHLEELAMK
jgi:transcriptional regulator with XRE-family HTH domain